MDESAARIEDLLWLLSHRAREHAVLLIHTDGTILWGNAGAERILGIAAGDLTGEPLSRFFTPEDVASGIPDHEMRVARQHGTAEDDRWQLRADGSRFWASGALIALCGDDGRLRGFGKVLRDRTELKAQIDTLRNRIAALLEADRRKDVFLGTLSHELRSPLMTLGGAVGLLRHAAPGHADLEYPIRLLERQIEFLRRLVDDLMDVSRISFGKLDMKLERVVLQENVAQAVEAVSLLITERRHTLEMLFPSGPIALDADPVRLHQIFVNLLTNAAKYSPEGGRIWVRGTTEADDAVVRVEDCGAGIAADLLPTIFDLFTQAETRAPRQGLGLGLRLVKDLVALHGGSVQAASPGLGKGSTFTVRLPLKPD